MTWSIGVKSDYTQNPTPGDNHRPMSEIARSRQSNDDMFRVNNIHMLCHAKPRGPQTQ